MTKKLISMIVAMVMLVSMIPNISLASTEFSVIENFNGYTGSGVPYSNFFSGSAADGSIESSPSIEEWGNCMRMSSATGKAPYINIYPGSMPKKVSVSFNMMFAGGNGERRLSLRDRSDNLHTLMNTQDKSIYIFGEKVADFDLIEYYTFRFDLDSGEGKCVFSLNGEKLCEKNFPEDLKGILSGLKLEQHATGSRSSIFVDNLKIFEGEEPATVLSEKKSNADERVTEMLESSVAYFNTTDVVVKYGERLKTCDNDEILSSLTDGQAIIPLRNAVESLGGTVEASETGAKVTYDGHVAEFTFGSPDIKTPSKLIKMPTALNVVNGVSYVCAKELCEAFELYYFTDPRGLILLSKKDFSKNLSMDEELLTDLVRTVCYDRPTPDELIEDYVKTGLGDVHPSLVVGPDGFEKMKWRIENYEEYRRCYETIKNNCDKNLSMAPIEHKRSDGRRLDNAQKMYSRYITPALIIYNLSGEEKYAEFAWKHLEVLCSDAYPDWGQESAEHLNVAELSSVVALSYDWLYHWLGEERREIVKTALIEKGIKVGIQFHDENKWWLKSVWNWNMSLGGGLSLASMAMMGEEPFLCSDLMSRSIKSMEYCLSSFYPDGSWAEGLGYWSYVMLNLTNCVSTAEVIMGTDYGIFNTPGLALTPFMPSHFRGPAGNFNFHDTGTESHVGEVGYFAQRLNNPGIMYLLEKNILTEPTKWGDLLWYAPEFVDPASVEVPTDMYYENIDTMFMKQNLTNSSIYTGLHAGSNNVGHAHLDSGNFILDANGERWIVDPGKDHLSYVISKDLKWDVWALRTESHNCIVINPDKSGGQDDESYSPIIEHQIKDKGAYAIADLTDAYEANIKEYKRGLMLTDNRRAVVVRDEIKSAVENDIRWSVTTIAPEIIPSEDGRSVLLKNKKNSLYMQIIEGDGKFEVSDANPLPTSPDMEGQISRKSMKQISIWNKDVKNMSLSVAFIPLVGDETVPVRIPEAVPLSKWSTAIPDGIVENPELTDIKLDGETISGFNPENKDYIVRLSADDEIPEVTASGENVDIEIMYGGDYIYTATIKVTSRTDKTMNALYQVAFYRGAVEIELKEENELKIVGVTVSDEPQEANPAASAIDGNLATRWSAMNEQWIMVELEEESDIGIVGIATYLGDQRCQLLDIEISADGENWTQVFSGASSGTSDDIIPYPFDTVRGKFVRINCHGTDVGEWNSITEIEVYKE